MNSYQELTKSLKRKHEDEENDNTNETKSSKSDKNNVEDELQKLAELLKNSYEDHENGLENLKDFESQLFKLKEESDVNINLKFGSKQKTFLHILVKISSAQEHLQLMERLITNGANVNAVDSMGQTPLHYASQETFAGSNKMLKILIKYNADEKAKDRDGKIPLHYAVKRYITDPLNAEITTKSVRELLKKTPGEVMKITDKNGITPESILLSSVNTAIVFEQKNFAPLNFKILNEKEEKEEKNSGKTILKPYEGLKSQYTSWKDVMEYWNEETPPSSDSDDEDNHSQITHIV